MIREILCLSCARSPIAEPPPKFGKMVEGNVSVECVCDWCNTKLHPGFRVVCRSQFRDSGGKDYWPWEAEFLKGVVQ